MGRGKNSEWLGSQAYDGHPENMPAAFKGMVTESAFRAAVSEHLVRDDATLPEMGWPWPWEDSQTTDYAYAFDEGRVWACCFGYAWWPIDEEEPELDDGQAKTAEFPDMTERGNVAVAGSTRSGVMVFRIR